MTEPTAPEFVYKPLIATDEIRLLVLHPAADVSAPINYSLEHATLSQYEQDIINHYTALSYVWGDATDTREIHLEGFPFQITVSLESALRHIRDSKREMRVWADALCINQADIPESNWQVSQMRSMYSVARNTIIYPGEANGNTDFVFD